MISTLFLLYSDQILELEVKVVKKTDDLTVVRVSGHVLACTWASQQENTDQ